MTDGLKFKVLLIDDEVEILDICKDFIEDLGHEALMATTLDEAREQLKIHEQKIIFILSDLNIGNESGLELRRSLSPELKKIPFALLSGFLNQQLLEEALEEKICKCFHKPMSEADIKPVIEKETQARIEEIRDEYDLILDFITDANPLVESIETGILKLEESKGDLNETNNLMRLMHTIKGTSGCVGLKQLSKFAHQFEDLFTELKNGKVEICVGLVNVFLQGLDLLKTYLKNAEHQYNLNESDFEATVEIFNFTPSEADLAEIAERHNKKTSTTQVANTLANLDATQTNDESKDKVSVAITELDYFMELSGELTVSRNSTLNYMARLEEKYPRDEIMHKLDESLGEVHKICNKIQSLIEEIRKVPLAQVFKAFPRVVRDVAKSSGKEVDFKVKGSEIKVDNTLAKVLSNSLVHMIRNSIDHGLEKPEDRPQMGKSKEGQLLLAAEDDGDNVIIKIKDDGKGIHVDTIKKRVVEKGLKTEAELAELTDNEIRAMIFEPGFSTAEVVTDISGRGVGMDMVRNSVQDVGGHILIDSIPNKGTEFTLTLPKPKAVLIMGALFVRVQNSIFAIPQREIIKVINTDHIQGETLYKNKDELFINYQNQLLPVVFLCNKFKLTPQSCEPSMIVMLQSEGHSFAVNVDEVYNVEQIVVKELKTTLNTQNYFLGATYINDDLALVINSEGIAENLHLQKKLENSLDQGQNNIESYSSNEMATIRFKLNTKGHYVIPLNFVFRLEEFSTKRVSCEGNQPIIHYNNKTLPLFYLCDYIGLKSDSSFKSLLETKEKLPVIVLHHRNQQMGIVVDAIHEIINLSVDYDKEVISNPYLVGAIQHQEHTYSLVDVLMLFEKLEKQIHKRPLPTATTTQNHKENSEITPAA